MDEDTESEDEREEDSPNRPRKFWSINEIIQQTEEMAHTHETCVMVNEEPQTFNEAITKKEWREARRRFK